MGEVRAQLQAVLSERERFEQLYISVKSDYTELKIRHEARNREFVDWRKEVAAKVFSNMDTE